MKGTLVTIEYHINEVEDKRVTISVKVGRSVYNMVEWLQDIVDHSTIPPKVELAKSILNDVNNIIQALEVETYEVYNDTYKDYIVTLKSLVNIWKDVKD